MTIEQMKYVDVRTVDPKTLVDRSQLKIDESLPREERLKQYIAQLKNPYCYLDDGVVVKVSFNDVQETTMPIS